MADPVSGPLQLFGVVMMVKLLSVCREAPTAFSWAADRFCHCQRFAPARTAKHDTKLTNRLSLSVLIIRHCVSPLQMSLCKLHQKISQASSHAKHTLRSSRINVAVDNLACARIFGSWLLTTFQH